LASVEEQNGGNADPEGVLYQNANEQAWDLEMSDMSLKSKQDVSNGKCLYNANCTTCHIRPERKWAGLSVAAKSKVVNQRGQGSSETGRMPSFMHLLLKKTGPLSPALSKHTETKSKKPPVTSDTAKKSVFPIFRHIQTTA